MPTKAERRELDLVALEERVAREATEELKKKLHTIARRMELYRESNPATRRLVRSMLVSGLTEVANGDELLVAAETIREGAREAFRAGIREAAEDIRRDPDDFLAALPFDLFELGRDTADRAREEIEESIRRIEQAEDPDDVEEAVLRSHRAVTSVERGARWGVNRGLASGVDEVATATGAERLWIGERDACVHCAAYIGERAGAGGPFAAGLTFGAKPLTSEPVANPPLHPNCRCRIRLWRREDGDELPNALKREAVRSILRGWSLPSESERTRLQAADRLLKRGVDMPKSVQDYARRAIRTGRFPRGRDFGSTQAIEKPEPKKRTTKKVLPADEPEPVTKIGFEALPRFDPKVVKSAESLAAVNPNYGTGPEWGVNCQRTTVAWELRRRGFDVTAQPNHKGRSRVYPWDAIAALLRTRPKTVLATMREVEPGTPGSREIPGKAAKWERPSTVAEVGRIIDSWPNGSRGWVGGGWKTGQAHIWNVEKTKGGKVVFIDAQPGIAGGKAQNQLHGLKYGQIFLMRVDDKDFADPAEIIEHMVKPVDREAKDR